ncbi:MAG: NADH-quinone oxidoreductase subunit NuoF [Spirochaetaceae bacterium]|nr:NADH-quinone oxidoreductase subunit NuoF [Spirochaetaceae bacterium]
MEKIKNYDELKAKYRQNLTRLTLREVIDEQVKKDIEQAAKSTAKHDILVCAGTGCTASRSLEIITSLQDELKKQGIEGVNVMPTGCFGFCEQGPIALVMPEDTFYVKVKPEDAAELVETHIKKGERVGKLIYHEPIGDTLIEKQHDMPFYKKQKRIALQNCGLIDPEDIDEYVAMRGFQALGKVLFELKPAEVIDIMKKSGLRGRGGAGFPIGLKWEFAAKYQSSEKFVLCNADEGDPGAFMDRGILEGDPCSVLEAMTIAGYVIGANKGYIYIRAEYPLAIERLNIALKQLRTYGLLGDNILGSGFNFDVELKFGAGAFVCGEETALIHSIEGQRGEPTTKPPFPAEKGLWDQPTIINNVETLVNVPRILLNGPEWYAAVGTEESKGTKVFALAGMVNNVGLVEVPMGVTLREIVYEIGGGIKNHKKFKAVQTGGPSGGLITKENLDTPITYKNLSDIGSMMGSGGMIVLDETSCMVDVAKFYLEFTEEESCGKCTSCRVGTKRLHEMLIAISEGKAPADTLEKLEELSNTIVKTSLCGLGQTAPNPVLSSLRFFREEYLEHINDKKCRAGVCKSLLSYIVNDNCIGCTVCAKKCPAECISLTDRPVTAKLANGKVPEGKFIHIVNQAECTKCGICKTACKFNAIDLI